MNKKLLFSLTGSLLLGVTSCEVSDFISDTFGSEEKKLPEEIADAKTYFDQYASLEIDYELIGMHPGVIVPQWDDAIAVQNGEMVSINVPLFTEATYSGAFYIDRANPDETFSTSLLQRLVIVKYLGESNYNCYVSTIIPDRDCASKNRAMISRRFLSGDTATTFSGTVIYSTVTTNYTVAVERYSGGECIESISILNPEDAVIGMYESMEQIIGAKEVTREISLMSRSGGEFGGIQLPGVTIIGTPGGSGGGTPSVPSLPPPPDPPFPNNPTPPGSNPPVVPPPHSGGSSGGGSGSSSGSSSSNDPQEYKYSKTDKLVTKKKSIPIPKQTGQNCVTNILDYLSESYFEFDASKGPFDFYALLLEGKLPGEAGVSIENLPKLINHFFVAEQNVSNFKQAIDLGYTLVSLRRIASSKDYHCVLIVGYTQGGRYIYVDTSTAKTYTAPASSFNKYYTFIIKGML
ncbi:hypothetical protein E4T81_09515 [Barnesiella sp. WM24]|uniref:hypothetical protein n=1 Tax=Barnesiella sp. WM24 TaxID=2558278 RepID=UPI001072CA4C|nr:hypothetical protein [Barnesiella sp. WM24]TFU93185.1 hypothetical protein E4T81_09515 [Barnesiella sp. WM24]